MPQLFFFEGEICGNFHILERIILILSIKCCNTYSIIWGNKEFIKPYFGYRDYVGISIAQKTPFLASKWHNHVLNIKSLKLNLNFYQHQMLNILVVKCLNPFRTKPYKIIYKMFLLHKTPK